MERKISGQGKPSAALSHLLRMLKLTHGSEGGPLDASACVVDKENLSQPVTYNPQGYITVRRRIHEAEAEKGIVIIEARHDRWKAGGAL